MPLPRALARFNRRLTNRILGPLARVLPGFGVVVHRGRQSGRWYRTPVNVFARHGGLLVALTYGPDSDWVRNVLAGGGCSIETRGRRLRLRDPRLIHDETRRLVPAILRPIGRLGRVADFLDLTVVAQTASAVPGWVPLFNTLATRLLAAGMPMGPNALLSVSGRRSGLPRTTPVSIIAAPDGRRFVIGVYGEADWVRNLRAAGRASIGARGRRDEVAALELAPAEREAFFKDVFAPMVRRYGGLGAWIVRHVDRIDINAPAAAATGRPVFELRQSLR